MTKPAKPAKVKVEDVSGVDKGTLIQAVLRSYADAGMILSFRQLYYVTRALGKTTGGVGRKKTTVQIDTFSALRIKIGQLYEEGLINNSIFRLNSSKLLKPSCWVDAADALETLQRQFHIDIWKAHSNRLEVWYYGMDGHEAFVPVCREYHIGLRVFSYRPKSTFPSEIEVREACAELKKSSKEHGRQVTSVIYMGPWKRGIENEESRFKGLLADALHPYPFTFERCGINEKWVKAYDLARNPSDTDSYEPESADPRVVDQCLKNIFTRYVDENLFKTGLELEDKNITIFTKLRNLVRNF